MARTNPIPALRKSAWLVAVSLLALLGIEWRQSPTDARGHRLRIGFPAGDLSVSSVPLWAGVFSVRVLPLAWCSVSLRDAAAGGVFKVVNEAAEIRAAKKG